MRLTDVNILIYAHREDAPEHDQYAEWLQALTSAPEPFAVADVILAWFLCTVTNGRIFDPPTPMEGARYTVTDRNSVVAAVRAGPVWSPDGTELFYETVLPNRIVTMDVTTEGGFLNRTERELPIVDFYDISPYRDYGLMPDGERFLVAFPADQADSGDSIRPQINIVLNWFEELKERVPIP